MGWLQDRRERREQVYKLTGRGGTVLVGRFDVYTEDYVDRVAGWYGPPSETSVGHIDFILEDGPIISLPAENGSVVGWAVEVHNAQ